MSAMLSFRDIIRGDVFNDVFFLMMCLMIKFELCS